VARREQATSGEPALALASDKTIVPLPGATAGHDALVPDLTGLSARDALRALGQLGLTAQLHGDGLVTAQRPAPGTPLERGGAATLWLKRAP
jgi:hypothetical protein